MDILPKVVVVTPTIGSPSLKIAIESVAKQSYDDIMHLLVIDGEQFTSKVNAILNEVNKQKIKVIALPFNTGYGLYNGHRIYAATSFIIEAEYVFFLDEDNWYDSNHVSSLVTLMESDGLDWSYSLRKIYDHELQYLTDDNCESIGPWPPYSNMDCLVDTSCYAIRRNILMQVGHHWLGTYFADRNFYKKISLFSNNFNSTCLYTLNYVLKEKDPPNAQFFLNGNSHMMSKYNNTLPWNTKRVL